MKIGIITIFKADNYGAELQAFALQRKLELMGYDCELIDHPFYKHYSHQKSRLSKPLFDIGWKNKIKEALFPLKQKLQSKSVRQQRFRRQQKIDDFHRKNTNLSKTTYHSVESLNEADHPYDAFIAGSDQIWNPRMNSSLDPYFLTFVPDGKRKISYASSFGVACLPTHVKPVYAQRLATFTALSVREGQGVAIVRELLNRDAEQSLDPTLLLTEDEWETVSGDSLLKRKSPYVLLYDLGSRSAVADLGLKLAGNIIGAKVYRICGGIGGVRRAGVEDVNDASPSDFVALIKDAAAIVTNSFHGTAFAVNFRKPFYTILPGKMQNSSRIESFLELVGLSHCLIKGDNSSISMRAHEYDWDAITSRLSEARTRSEAYLRRALESNAN